MSAAGDLSLSNALGGLRIANPDEEAVASPSPDSSPAPAPYNPDLLQPVVSTSSEDGNAAPGSRHLLPALSHESEGQFGSGLGFNPDSYMLQNGGNERVGGGSSSVGGQSPISSHQRSPTTPSAEFPRQPQQQRLLHRKSLPLNAHAQAQQREQLQYMQYPPTYPHQFRNPSVQSSSSNLYQLPNTSSSSTGSYRYRDELNAGDGGAYDIARSSPRISNSGMGAASMPVNIPARNGSRTYRSSSRGMNGMNGGNGPLPPRQDSGRARAPTNGSGTGYEPTTTPYAGSAPQPNNADEWRERGGVSVRQETDSSGQVQTRVTKKGVKDFNFGRTLGEGSYSTVLAATDRQNGKEYAIKVLDKRHIIKEKKVKYVNIERDTLNRLTEHPGIVRLYYTFQDERSLYFVLDLATGGELLGVLKKMGSFDVECTRFYAAQILDSIAYMHSRGVIHRDLKPENVLLDRDTHTKITDFGTAKILPDPKPAGVGGSGIAGGDVAPGDPTDGAENDRANSFVGTAEYVSPELLQRSNACKASDLWAFGCIIYQLLAGRPPFKAANEYLTFQKILNLEYTFPDGFPATARDLVERLLVLDPARRLPVEHIKNHLFFEGVTWGKGLWRQKPPRIKPYVPPPSEPIKLNGGSTHHHSSYVGPGGMAAAGAHVALTQQQQQSQQRELQQRPSQLRGVTDLPPPSQLDIEWGPVLRENERILKLGNLFVTAASKTHSSPNSSNNHGGSKDASNGGGETPATPTPGGGGGEKTKLRSFFSGNTNRRRERLVLITSHARLVVAAAGGNEKKAKMEVDCSVASGAVWGSFVDGRGLTGWTLDCKDKHLTLEDPRATTSDPQGSKYSTADWLETLTNAREISSSASSALSRSYSGDSNLLLSPVLSSTGSGEDAFSVVNAGSAGGGGVDGVAPLVGPGSVGSGRHHHMRQTLRKNTDDAEGERGGGKRRFSKRHSKGGLAAVF